MNESKNNQENANGTKPLLADSLPLVIDLRDDGLYFIRQGNVEIIRQPEFEEDGRRWAYETIYRIGVVYKR